MTADVVVCTPSLFEERAVREVLGKQVLRTGVGRVRSTHAAAGARLQHADAVAVLGIAGGLDPDIRTGDVVVATGVWAGERLVRSLPSATLVAARLRREGLTVWLGPLVSCDHVVGEAERRRLRTSGAVAVDMESAWLLPVDRPAAVVRVVADVAGRPLLRPATLGRLRSAIATLPGAATGVAAWSEAVTQRRVLLAEPRSFCAGVDRAIESVARALEQRGAPVYVRKQIVHNQHVVADLRSRGAVFVEELDEVPSGSTVVFSAHGVSPAVRRQSSARSLDVIDATCPLVGKVHSEVRRFSDRGDTVIFIGHAGHAGHEETEGTMGERPGQTMLVENVEDAGAVQVADPERVSYLVQTTLSVHEVRAIVDVLAMRFPALRSPATDDICYATTNRQDALTSVATDSDLVLVVGSQNSSNSLRLVETARRLGTPAHLVDDAGEVDLDWLAGVERVGVTAGASAPQTLVDELVEELAGLGPVQVDTRQLAKEDVSFTLPKEVRSA